MDKEAWMPGELLVACSLRPTELPARLAEMGALGDAALVDVSLEPARAQLRFAAGDGVRKRVEGIVAAESRCCSFLTMSVGEQPDLVELTIHASQGADAVLEAIVQAFSNQPKAA
jgi:hypothetical protein